MLQRWWSLQLVRIYTIRDFPPHLRFSLFAVLYDAQRSLVLRSLSFCISTPRGSSMTTFFLFLFLVVFLHARSSQLLYSRFVESSPRYVGWVLSCFSTRLVGLPPLASLDSISTPAAGAAPCAAYLELHRDHSPRVPRAASSTRSIGRR